MAAEKTRTKTANAVLKRWLVGAAIVVTATAAATGSAATGNGGPAGSSAFRPAALRAQAPAAPARLDGRLADAVDSSTPLRAARDAGLDVVGGNLRVVVQPRPGDAAPVTSAIDDAGGVVEARAAGLVQALVSPEAATRLAARGDVLDVRSPAQPFAETVPGEGVNTTNAALWQKYGLTGAGVKVAIIDLGFAGLGARQAEGEIPNTVVTADYCGGAFSTATNHGTAVAEIVSEEAPGAQLYLYCVNSEVTLAQAEQAAKANGVRVINHSVGWFNTGRGDGSGGPGTPDAIVADAKANNILWVNAAGNEATSHWGGTFVDTNGDSFMDFVPGDETDSFSVAAGAQVCAFLRWDDWPTATGGDYDIGLYDSATKKFVAVSSTDQTATPGPPTEELCWKNSTGATQVEGVAIQAYRNYASPPPFDLFIEGQASRPEYTTAERSIGDPAASPSAFAVGAVCWQSGTVESYSSRGPTISGLTKPDVSAPDSVSSATYGSFSTCPSGFAGTSASAPAVVGLAALIAQRYPSFTAAQIRSYIVEHARDAGITGPDTTYGAGVTVLPAIAAPLASYPTPSSINVTRTGAVLTATVDPGDSPTTVSFEYGTSSSYGSTTPAQTVDGTGQGPVTVTATLTGLSAGAEIHFRLDAKNLGGAADGPDQSFATPPDEPPAVHALAASGRLGRSVPLRFTILDDTGEAREAVKIYRGASVVKTLALDFAPAASTTTRVAAWLAPRTQKGKSKWKFCVQAWDRADQPSTLGCAPITLR